MKDSLIYLGKHLDSLHEKGGWLLLLYQAGINGKHPGFSLMEQCWINKQCRYSGLSPSRQYRVLCHLSLTLNSSFTFFSIKVAAISFSSFWVRWPRWVLYSIPVVNIEGSGNIILLHWTWTKNQWASSRTSWINLKVKRHFSMNEFMVSVIFPALWAIFTRDTQENSMPRFYWI